MAKKSDNSSYMVFVGIGAELIGIELVMIFIGTYIDRAAGWKGYGLAACLVIGLTVWLVHVVKMLQKLSAEEDDSTGS